MCGGKYLFQIKRIVHSGLVRNTRLGHHHWKISPSSSLGNIDKGFFQLRIYSRFAWVMWGFTSRWCLWKSGILLLYSFIFKGRVPTFDMSTHCLIYQQMALNKLVLNLRQCVKSTLWQGVVNYSYKGYEQAQGLSASYFHDSHLVLWFIFRSTIH